MTNQTSHPLPHLPLTTENRRASEMARLAYEGDLIVNAPYQRGSVWADDPQRIGLVKSWISGIPVPAIMVNDRSKPDWECEPNTYQQHDAGGAPYAVIDGRQRIETAVAWFFGDLIVPATWFDPDMIDTRIDTDDGPYVGYADLTTSGRRKVANRATLPVTWAQVTTVAAEADLYLLVNGAGTPQTPADMANAAAYSTGHDTSVGSWNEESDEDARVDRYWAERETEVDDDLDRIARAALAENPTLPRVSFTFETYGQRLGLWAVRTADDPAGYFVTDGAGDGFADPEGESGT